MFIHNNHVQYILLAEFDIDKGAIVKHQYPNETGTNEHILSELMLPDGAHLRAEDWTIFCLNQLTPDENLKADSNSRKRLLYVLNLVRTKHDTTAKRGARVKALAICTQHQYLHIYKPVLLLAMEKYFQNPSIEVLESLYRAVNAMDLSRMPKFSWYEKQILRASNNKTIFEERFIEEHQDDSDSDDMIESPKYNPVRRGTYIDLASGSVHKKKPVISKDTHFFETEIKYDGINLPMKIPLTMNPEEVGDFSIIQLINTFSPNGYYPGSPNPHHPHLDSSGPYTHPIMILLNGLLTQKRIIFLGYGHPSGEVANYVLAACALGSGCGTVLKGFTERAFPYTNLTSVDDLLKCPGFIAGVTNPTYEEHTGWWDILCNISTGKIQVSSSIAANYPIAKNLPIIPERSLDPYRSPEAQVESKRENTDAEFINDILVSIHSHYGEASIRAKFQEYVLRFVRLASLYEERVCRHKVFWNSEEVILGVGPIFQDAAAEERELKLNANRIEGWRQTISYKYYQRDLKHWSETSNLKNLDVYRQVNKLKKLKNIPDAETIVMFEAFLNSITNHKQTLEFLSYLPQNQGGLAPIGMGLFHSNPKIRVLTAKIFKKLETDPIGMKFVQDLSRFQRIAYEKQAFSLAVGQ